MYTELRRLYTRRRIALGMRNKVIIDLACAAHIPRDLWPYASAATIVDLQQTLSRLCENCDDSTL